jgi:lambda repressor-like predicted transcriptional regulator
MARSAGATESSRDIGAILDEALQAEMLPGRQPTKTQQIREQRVKIAALRKKGYTLVNIAEMVGVSKDTLRQALITPKKTKKGIAAQTVPSEGVQTKDEETKAKTSVKAVVVVPKVVNPGRKRKYPSNEDL